MVELEKHLLLTERALELERELKLGNTSRSVIPGITRDLELKLTLNQTLRGAPNVGELKDSGGRKECTKSRDADWTSARSDRHHHI